MIRSIATKKAGRVRKHLWASRYLYLFLLPSIIYILFFNYAPLYGIQIAFKYFQPIKGIIGSRWIGFDNFTRLFKSYYFGRLLRNTVSLSLYNLIAGFPFPIFLALLFNEIKNEKLKKAVQTVSYLPHFISIIVLVGILNLLLSQSTGLLNTFRVKMGMQTIPFMVSASLFPSVYVWSGIWQHAGWNAIIYIAALTSIDPQLHEAAQIDGASRLQRIWHINLPGIRSTAVILFIMNVGHVMNLGFEKVYLMQNDMNIETSQVIATFVYESGLIKADYGFSTAIGLFNNVINVILLVIVNSIAKKLGETSLF